MGRRQARRDFISAITKLLFLASTGVLPARAQSPDDTRLQPKSASQIAKQRLDRIFDAIDLERGKIDQSKFDVFAKAQAIGADLDQLFAFVRDEVRFEPYWGVLRGATGTLTGMAGNSFDQSVLLAELLRQHSFTVRFAVGEINQSQVESLLKSFVGRQLAKPRTSTSRVQDDWQAVANLLDFTEDETSEIKTTISGRAEDFEESLWDDAETEYLSLLSALRSASQTPPTASNDDIQQRMAAEAREHAWVQVRDNSGQWIDFDPAFGNSRRGLAPTRAPDIFEDTMPAQYHHAIDVKVMLRAKASSPQEEVDAEGLTEHVLLQRTIETARFADDDVQFVNQPTIPNPPSNNLSESIEKLFEDVSEFTPIIFIGDEQVVGKSFNMQGDVYSSGQSVVGTTIGNATNILSGLLNKTQPRRNPGIATLWVDYTITSPRGRRSNPRRRSHRRYIVDATELLKWSPAGEKAWTRRPRADWDSISARPSFFRAAKLSITTGPSSDLANLYKLYSALIDLRKPIEEVAVNDGPATETQTDKAPLLSIATLSMQAFELQRDNATQSLGDSRFPGMSWYVNEPNLVLFETLYAQNSSGKFAPSIGYDIARNGIRSIAPTPNTVSDSGRFGTFPLQRGVMETVLENRLVQQRETGGSDTRPIVEGTPAVFSAARAEGIKITVLKGPESLARLTDLEVSEGAKPFIENDLRFGHIVVIPARNVTLKGRARIGWWRIDEKTGTTLGRMDTGRGAALTEYEKLMRKRLWLLGRHPVQQFLGIAADAATAFFYTAVLVAILLFMFEAFVSANLAEGRSRINRRRPPPG